MHVLLAARLLAQATTTTTAPEAVSKNPILPAGNEILWGTFSFVVLFFVMWKFAFPAVAKSMQARTDKIRNNIDEAQKVRNEAEQILADYQRQLADARGEANRIIEEARQAAEQVRRDLVARAEAEADDLRRRAQEDARLAGERAMSDLRGQVATLSVELAEKIVEHNLDRDTQLALIENYINSVGNGARN